MSGRSGRLTLRGRPSGLLALLGSASAGQILRRNLLHLGPCPLFFSIFKLIAHLLHHVGGDRRRIVPPVRPHISQDRGELLICILTLPGLHRVVERFSFDLDRSLQALEHNRNQMVRGVAQNNFRAGQRRILSFHALTSHLMAGDAVR